MEALTLMLTITLVVCLYALHKIRRIHREQYRIAEDARASRHELEQIFPQIQAYLELSRLLDLRQPLPALRGWAASPDFLLEIANHARRAKPATILECSSGATTLILARCCEMNGRGHVYSLEHDPMYADRTRSVLRAHNLERWATVIDAPLKPRTELAGRPWYSLDALPSTLPPIDMLVIDGPPGETGDQARYPALPQLYTRLADAVTVFLDDAGRAGEREVVDAWKAEYPDFRFELRPLEKGCAVVFRPGRTKPASALPLRPVDHQRIDDRRVSRLPD